MDFDRNYCIDLLIAYTPGYVGDFSNIDSIGSGWSFVLYWFTYVVNYVGFFDCQLGRDLEGFLMISIIVLVCLSFGTLDNIRNKDERY